MRSREGNVGGDARKLEAIVAPPDLYTRKPRSCQRYNKHVQRLRRPHYPIQTDVVVVVTRTREGGSPCPWVVPPIQIAAVMGRQP